MTTEQDNSSTARNAERVQPVVVTSESIAAMYSGAAPKEQPVEEVPKDEPQAEVGNDGEKGEKRKGGKPFSERISEVVAQRRAAESEAERAKRENAELRAQLEALTARAEPVKEEPRPERSKFEDDEAYIEAVSDWKANQAIAKREREQQEAQVKAQQAQLTTQWKRAQERAKAEIEDYEDVIKASDVQLPVHLHQAILESDIGPHLAYYFAKHPDEAKRYAGMSPTTALRQLGKLEDRLFDDSEPAEPKKAPSPAVEKSKAPAPITPVKDGRSLDPGPAASFEEYRTRRLAEQKR